MDPRDKIFAFIFGTFMTMVVLSLFMIITGCVPYTP